MRHINRYTAWPNGWRKKQSSDGYGEPVEFYDATAAFDPRTLQGSTVWGVPKFLWRGGATPLIAPDPATSLAAVGSVTTGQPTPYRYPDGTDATCDVFGANAYRADTTHLVSPTLTNDVVITVKFRSPHYTRTANNGLISNKNGGAGTFGFITYITPGAAELPSWFVRVGASTGQDNAVTTAAQRAWGIHTTVLDRNGLRGYSYINMYSGGSAAFPAGSLAGNGIAIGAGVNGLDVCPEAGFAVEWAAIWYDDGIYGTWSADSWRLLKRLHMESLGLRETLTNSKYWFYTGGGANGGASYPDHNDRWTFAYGDDHGPICAGNPKGLLLLPGEVLLSPGTAYNFDPTGVAGWTLTGGAMATVDDSAALATAKADVWGPMVYEFTNASGAPQTAYCGSDTTASVYKMFCLARYVSGAGATIGFRETATGNYTAWANIVDGYALTRSAYTSLAAGFKLAIQIPDGCVLRFIGHAAHGGSGIVNGLSGYPIPYRGAPWVLTPNAYTETTTEHTPVSASGSLLVTLAPVGWSLDEGKADARVFRTVADATSILFGEDTAPGGWAMTDGTTQLQMAAAFGPTAGVYQRLWMAWTNATGLMYLQDTANPASLVTAAYDGAMPISGALEAWGAQNGSCFAIKYIDVRQIP